MKFALSLPLSIHTSSKDWVATSVKSVIQNTERTCHFPCTRGVAGRHKLQRSQNSPLEDSLRLFWSLNSKIEFRFYQGRTLGLGFMLAPMHTRVGRYSTLRAGEQADPWIGVFQFQEMHLEAKYFLKRMLSLFWKQRPKKKNAHWSVAHNLLGSKEANWDSLFLDGCVSKTEL